jgi:hypothetical protein
MTLKNYTIPQIETVSIIKRMLTGAVIGLAIISVLVFSVDEPNPEWGKFWMIRPLIITPIVAAFGFLSFFLKDFVRPQSDWMRLVVILLSIIAFIIALWMGTILGLDGTLWN